MGPQIGPRSILLCILLKRAGGNCSANKALIALAIALIFLASGTTHAATRTDEFNVLMEAAITNNGVQPAEKVSVSSLESAIYDGVFNNNDYFVLDVRQRAEFAAGHINYTGDGVGPPGAINIYYRDLGKSDALAYLDSKLDAHTIAGGKNEIAVYHNTRNTGRMVAYYLNQSGYNAKELKFGMSGWTGDLAVGGYIKCTSFDANGKGISPTGCTSNNFTVTKEDAFNAEILSSKGWPNLNNIPDSVTSADLIEVIRLAYDARFGNRSKPEYGITATELYDLLDDNQDGKIADEGAGDYLSNDPFILSNRGTSWSDPYPQGVYYTDGHIPGAVAVDWAWKVGGVQERQELRALNRTDFMPTDRTVVHHCWVCGTQHYGGLWYNLLGYTVRSLDWGVHDWNSENTSWLDGTSISYVPINAPYEGGDNQPPYVLLKSPSDNQSIANENVTFTVFVLEGGRPNVTLWGNWSGGWGIKDYNDTLENATEYNFTVTGLQINESYTWNVKVIDEASNVNWSESNFTVHIIKDKFPPEITFTPSNGSYLPDSSPLLTVTMKEDHPDTIWYSVDGWANITGCLFPCLPKQFEVNMSESWVDSSGITIDKNSVGFGGDAWSSNALFNSTNVTGDNVALLSGPASLDPGTIALLHLGDWVGNTAQDSSPNENNGTLPASPNKPVWTTGKFGSALEFDGDDDYLNISTVAGEINAAGGTAMLWVNATDPTLWDDNSNDRLFSFRDSSSDNYILIFNTGGDQYLRFRYRAGGGTFTDVDYAGSQSWNANEWHHIAVTWNTTDGELKLYADGNKVENGTLPGTWSAAISEAYLGAAWNMVNGWEGAIDDFHILNRTLSDTEIQNVYNSTYLSYGNTTSTSRDAGEDSSWVQIKFEGNVPPQTNVSIYASSSSDNSTWTEYLLAKENASSGTFYPITNQSRYAKWILELTTLNSSVSPTIYNVTVAPQMSSATSVSKDAESINGSHWKEVKFDGSVPNGTNVTIYVNTSGDNATWTEYLLTKENASSGTFYALPSLERYAKWKVELRTNDTLVTPSISEVTMNSLLSYGQHSVTVYANDTGSYNSSNTSTFYVDNIFPTRPSPLSPTNNIISSDATPDLNWTNVTEENFANYSIEVDDSADFSSVDYRYSATDISETNYSVTEAWAENTWYWRVTAFDKAGNSNSSGYYAYERVAGRYENGSIDFPANTTVTIEATGANTTLVIVTTENVTGEINITLTSNRPSGTSDMADLALSQYRTIDAGSNIEGNLSYVVVMSLYTDEEVLTAEIQETSLRPYKWNGSDWEKVVSSLPWVLGSGVNTTSNFAWSNVTMFSKYAVGGIQIPTPISPRITGSGGPYLPKTLTRAILTTSEDWRYATMAAGYAAANNYILLATPTNSMDRATITGIKWFDSLEIIGDKFVVSEGIEGTFKDFRKNLVPGFAKLKTSRIKGTNFIDTSVQLARKWKDPKGVIVVRGDIFADALVASQLSAAKESPIIYTMPNALWPSALEAIKDMGLDVTIIGGKRAVSTKVEDAIRGAGLNVMRIGGKDRYETAAMVGDMFINAMKKKNKKVDTITFISGKKGEWASTLGYRSFIYNSTILYTDDVEGKSAVPVPTKDFIAGHSQISSASILVNGGRPKGYRDVDSFVRDMQFDVDPTIYKFIMELDSEKKNYNISTGTEKLSKSNSKKRIDHLRALGVLYKPAGGGGGGGGGGDGGGDC